MSVEFFVSKDVIPSKAQGLGHDFEWDPSGTGVPRWTCRRRTCGRAVINYDGNVYGSATEHECTSEVAK